MILGHKFKRMKSHIILIGPTFPFRGGNSLFMSHLYEMLVKEYKITFINFSVMYPSLLFPGKTQLDVSGEHFNEVPSERLINSMNPISWKKAANRINELNPDLVVFDWWQPYFGLCYRGVSSFLNADLKKKIIFITENVISHESRGVDKLLTQIGLKHAKGFLALSNKVEREIAPMSKGRKVYRSELPNYGWYTLEDDFDKGTAKEALGFKADDIVFLFFGYVRKYKGLDILIDAFSILSHENPKYKLLIAGEFYDSPESYEQQIQKLEISDKVKIVNQYIPNEKVAQFFTLSEVVILPYRNATQSGILSIASAYNKPVIITSVGGLPEFVDDGQTGILVVTPSKEAVVKGVHRYFELKPTVDFSKNIEERNKGNGFENIIGVFQEMLEDRKS